MKSQLFILDRDMLKAMAEEEIEATWADMKELGIHHPPFTSLTIQCPAGPVIRFVGKDGSETLLDDSPGDQRTAKNAVIRVVYKDIADEQIHSEILMQDYKGKFFDLAAMVLQDYKRFDYSNLPVERFVESVGALSLHLLKRLVVALATRNVERTVTHNHLAKFGIGKKQDYEYVTTLRIGKITLCEGEPGHTGQTRRPHLRRGHIRNQHYGPKNQYVKRTWIEPIFVNGYSPDDDHRRAYNVSMGKVMA